MSGRAERQAALFQAKKAFNAFCACVFSYIFDSKNHFQAMPHAEKINGWASQ